MTRQQRRSKSRWVNRLKKRGYTYRRGKVWQRWRWSFPVKIDVPLPIFHADWELGIREGIEDGSETRLPPLKARKGAMQPHCYDPTTDSTTPTGCGTAAIILIGVAGPSEWTDEESAGEDFPDPPPLVRTMPKNFFRLVSRRAQQPASVAWRRRLTARNARGVRSPPSLAVKRRTC